MFNDSTQELPRALQLMLARDQAQAEELDELLWAFDNDAYIPHQIAGEDMDEEEALVLIAVPGTDATTGLPWSWRRYYSIFVRSSDALVGVGRIIIMA